MMLEVHIESNTIPNARKRFPGNIVLLPCNLELQISTDPPMSIYMVDYMFWLFVAELTCSRKSERIFTDRGLNSDF